MIALAVALGGTPPARAAVDAAALLRQAGIRPVVPRTQAPDFSLPALAGADGSLSDYRGSWVLLTFWATWCGPCRSELPTLEALHRSYENEGLVVVGVSVDTDSAPVAPFVAQMELSFPNYWDGSGRVGSSYLAASIPMTYLIDPDGRVAGLARGARDWMALAPVFERLLEAEPAGDGAAATYAPAGDRVSLSTVVDPPSAEVELERERVRPGETFIVTVRVTWSGNFDEYLLHPPEIALPEGVERFQVTASSSSLEGRSVVTYRILLRAAEPGIFALDPVELRYTPLLEQSPVASRLAGPTVEVSPRTLLGMAPRTALVGAGSLALLGVAGFLWVRRGKGTASLEDEAANASSGLLARFEAARAKRLSGDVRSFVLALVEIEREISGDEEEGIDQLVQGVRYGGRLPTPMELEQLERRVERRLHSLTDKTGSEERRALKLREDEET